MNRGNYMIKKEYEEKHITKKEKILVGEKMYCDECGSEINGSYFNVITGHHDWGNDSIDSMETKHYCRISCLGGAMVHYYVGEAHNSDTAYFNVGKEYFKSK